VNFKNNTDKKYKCVELHRRASIGLGQDYCDEKLFYDYIKENHITKAACALPKGIFRFMNEMERSAASRLNIFDHVRFYKDACGKMIIVSHPYSERELIENDKGFNDFCNKYGVSYKITEGKSWYYPKRTLLVEIFIRFLDVFIKPKNSF
jgi:hypothetical protein